MFYDLSAIPPFLSWDEEPHCAAITLQHENSYGMVMDTALICLLSLGQMKPGHLMSLNSRNL